MSADDHGSASTYSNHRCRCAPCRAAWAAYVAKRRAERVAGAGTIPHGTVGGYGNYGCRCEACVTANRRRYRCFAGPHPSRKALRLPEGYASVGSAVDWLTTNSTESVRALGIYTGRRLRSSVAPAARRRGLIGWSTTELDRLFPDLTCEAS